MSTSIVAFIIVLSVLIFFHELGHFLVARLFGVGVEKFSLGFGPRLIGKRVGRTDYRISAIPLGGYVKMIGEAPDAEVDPAERALSFSHKPVLARIFIVAAGPFFNLLLAVIIFFGIFAIAGTYILLPTVGQVAPDSPAAGAGLQPGDRIVAVDDRPIASWEKMAAAIAASDGRELVLTVSREARRLAVRLQPRRQSTENLFGETVERYVIGITAAGDVQQEDLSIGAALVQSGVQTYRVVELTVVSVAKIIQGTLSTKTIGGPIMIAEMAGKQAQAGVVNLLFFIGLISINLAILNILPIPVLDGGHLLFFFLEVVFRRPLSLRVREVAQQVGLFLLIMLMVLVFYNDITRVFFG